MALRARIVLAAAGRLTNGEIAELRGVSRPTVTKWRNRFAEWRVDGLLDEPRPGRPRTITDEQVEAVVIKTLESTPTNATHWSTRSMARRDGDHADRDDADLARVRAAAAPPGDAGSSPRTRSSSRRSTTSAACT